MKKTRYYIWWPEQRCFLNKHLESVYDLRHAHQFTHKQLLSIIEKSGKVGAHVRGMEA